MENTTQELQSEGIKQALVYSFKRSFREKKLMLDIQDQVCLEESIAGKTFEVLPQETDLDAYIYEQEKQKRLHEELIAEGYEIADDPASLESFVGTTQDIEVLCEMWTPRLLCKLFVKGTEHLDHSFHLVPLHQIVKWQYQVPEPRTTFIGKFIVGVRRVGEKQFVPALRLPLK